MNYKKEKEKSTYSIKEVKRIKINLDFILNNFPVHRTGLRLVSTIFNAMESHIKFSKQAEHISTIFNAMDAT